MEQLPEAMPPIIPTPEPKPLGYGFAFGSAMVVVLIVLVLSNILAIPFVVISVAQSTFAAASSPAMEAQIYAKKNFQSEYLISSTFRTKFPAEDIQILWETDSYLVKLQSHDSKISIEQANLVLTDIISKSKGELEIRENFQPVHKPLDLESMLQDPWVLIGSTFGLQLSMFLVWILGKRNHFVGIRALPQLHQGKLLRGLVIGAVLGATIAFTSDPIQTFLRSLFHLSNESIWEVVTDYPAWAKIATVILGVFGAPIFEELFFRGLILGLFLKINKPWVGIVFSSILFGMAHLQDVATITVISIMGIILGLTYWKTKSLYACIALHFVNNAIAFAALLMSS